MTPSSTNARDRDLALAAFGPPAWVSSLIAARYIVVSETFDAPTDMSAAGFQRAVTDAYRAIFTQLAAHPGLRAVRLWAFLPGIHVDLGGGLDRYMAFNLGRHEAFAAHFGAPAFQRGAIPTASAVGVPGATFHLHCLAVDEVGTAIENPRQVPAYRYSQRFGPRPPSFARATLLTASAAQPLLLVGGTASITGEDSHHTGDVAAQMRETLLNLASVIAASEDRRIPATDADVDGLLARYHDLRVYYPRPADRAVLAAMLTPRVSRHCHIDLVPATLCRAELLVEIEGVAFPDLSHSPGRD